MFFIILCASQSVSEFIAPMGAWKHWIPSIRQAHRLIRYSSLHPGQQLLWEFSHRALSHSVAKNINGTILIFAWWQLMEPRYASFNSRAAFIHTLAHWGRDKMAAVSQTTLSNAFSWMKMSEFRLRFHCLLGRCKDDKIVQRLSSSYDDLCRIFLTWIWHYFCNWDNF